LIDCSGLDRQATWTFTKVSGKPRLLKKHLHICPFFLACIPHMLAYHANGPKNDSFLKALVVELQRHHKCILILLSTNELVDVSCSDPVCAFDRDHLYFSGDVGLRLPSLIDAENVMDHPLDLGLKVCDSFK